MKKILFLTATMLLYSNIVFGQNPLLIPNTLSGTTIDLTLQNSDYQFYAGQNTTTMGANGSILGPTLLLNKGDVVDFSVDNQIGETTTIHWHGMHVSPENDGGPHTAILSDDTWNPSFTVLDKAATYWYHPHLHHKTNEHVSKGIAGLIIVRDEEEAALNLPRTYGEDDFPLIIQTKDFDAAKQIVVDSNNDDVVMVNATVDPTLSSPAQVIRFRILNGSSQRVFNLGLTNNKTFYQIATDGGLLATPNETTRLRLAPGERAEILIDFSGMMGQTIDLLSYASEFPNGIYGATNPGMGAGMTMTGYNPNPLNGADFTIMQFNIDAATSNAVTTIPNTLATLNPIPEAASNITRSLSFSPEVMGPTALNGNFLINNTSFDMDVINYTIPLNNTEIWSITNQSPIAHPFHIHDVQFYILDRNGIPPNANEQGLKDVVLIQPQETIRFITKFEDFANNDVPYMYHCHMLVHEDAGMMGQFKVVDNSTNIEEQNLKNEVSIYPNPSTGWLQVNVPKDVLITRYELVDILGRTVSTGHDVTIENRIELESLVTGHYVLKLVTNKGVLNYPITLIVD